MKYHSIILALLACISASASHHTLELQEGLSFYTVSIKHNASQGWRLDYSVTAAGAYPKTKIIKGFGNESHAREKLTKVLHKLFAHSLHRPNQAALKHFLSALEKAERCPK